MLTQRLLETADETRDDDNEVVALAQECRRLKDQLAVQDVRTSTLAANARAARRHSVELAERLAVSDAAHEQSCSEVAWIRAMLHLRVAEEQNSLAFASIRFFRKHKDQALPEGSSQRLLYNTLLDRTKKLLRLS
jgi:hypothetical protein